MIIDGHAHACGEYFNYESIMKVLDENKADKVVLCPGEVNSKKSYGLPVLSERFPQKDFMKKAIHQAGADKLGTYLLGSLSHYFLPATSFIR